MRLKTMVLFLLLMVTLSVNIWSQRSAFYDAYYLQSITKTNNGKFKLFIETRKILEYYFGSGMNDLELTTEITSNPFLSKYFEGPGRQSVPVGQSIPGLLGNLSGLDVTNIADGFAKFLVKRTKEELAIAFFNKFKEAIEDTNFRDIRTIFPETYRTIYALGDEIYQFDAYMQTFRESFEKDLRELTAHLPTIVENHPEFFRKRPDLAAILKSGCYFAEAFRYNQHPGDILNDYPSEYLDDLNGNWKGSLQTLQLLSSSLRDTSKSDTASYWVSRSQIKKLVNDEVAFKIYLGLIYEKAKHFENNSPIKFENKKLTDILSPVADNFSNYYSSYKSYFTDLSTRLNKIKTIIDETRKTESDSAKLELYLGFVNASIDFLETTSDFGKLVPWKDIELGKKESAFFRNIKDSLSNYFEVARSAANIVWDIKRRSYASALVNVASIYNIIGPQISGKTVSEMNSDDRSALDDKIDLFNTDIKKSINAPAAEALEDSVKMFNDIIHSKKIMSSIIKYGTFMSTIVQAKNSDEVSEAVEAFALPAGSSRIKRESSFNVALNSYVGLFIGREAIKGLESLSVFPLSKWNTTGVAAPIGVSLSWGHWLFLWPTDHAWSTSVFFSLVDLGTVASFRFSDDSTGQAPTIKLKDLFSPGIFISIGIPEWPVSLNFGAQMGPNLRSVQSTGNDFSNNIYWRYSFSICVDIPLLNFYTKPRE